MKAASTKDVFAREVAPGVFVYSLDYRLPAASRKLVDRMIAEGAESTRQAAEALRESLTARRNGRELPDH